MPMLNYGERAKFKNGTDKPFIYRGGLKELLLPAFANGPLHSRFPLQLFLSSTTSLLPLLTLALALAGRSMLQCPMGRVPLVSWTFPLEQEADAGAGVTAPGSHAAAVPARLGALCKALAEDLTSSRVNSYKGSC